MPAFGDFEVRIAADGEDIEEYGATTTDEKSVRCFIPSIKGQVSTLVHYHQVHRNPQPLLGSAIQNQAAERLS